MKVYLMKCLMGVSQMTIWSCEWHLCHVCFQFRVFTAPFHRVEFADFWLADQLNSLVVVLMDLEYLICFYIFELQWGNSKGLLPKINGASFILPLYNLITSQSCWWVLCHMVPVTAGCDCAVRCVNIDDCKAFPSPALKKSSVYPHLKAIHP